MAEYTIELRDVVADRGNIFQFPYEFYDESKRAKFENDFVRHFYFREIGQETIDRFLWYLEDKMNTVFPYYNELFKSALIEYSKTHNYDMTEKTTITRENEGQSAGVSSTVGQGFDKQNTESQVNDTGSSNREMTGTGKQTGEAEGTSNTSSSGDRNSNTTVDTSSTLTSEIQDVGNTKIDKGVTGSEHDENKFLDTPQGLLNLDGSKYLTELRDNKKTSSSSEDTLTESTNVSNRSDGTKGNTDTVENSIHTETSTTTHSETTENNSEETQSEDNSFTQESNGSIVFEGEQKTTHDTNTRDYSKGSSSEIMEHTRYGNIGVMTASDMIEKHIDLQKVLKQVEKLFFDECEDLFMLVY